MVDEFIRGYEVYQEGQAIQESPEITETGEPQVQTVNLVNRVFKDPQALSGQ